MGQLKVRPARHKAQRKGDISRAKRVLGSFHATCAEREERDGRARGQSQSREAVIESGMSKKVEKRSVAADDGRVETRNI